jgi:phage replication-related protein YjqB (UPF0714/DUF867 family)
MAQKKLQNMIKPKTSGNPVSSPPYPATSFQAITRHATEGNDFEIEYQFRDSEILVMSPHGGKIEAYTDVLAKIIASDTFSCYIFRGIREKGNGLLHITSHCFDEPVAIRAANRADTVVTIHGAGNKEADFIMIGGLDTVLCREMEFGLKHAEFPVVPPTRGMGAKHPMNICNRGKSGKGLQLELSYKFRMRLKDHKQQRRIFTESVRAVLLNYNSR